MKRRRPNTRRVFWLFFDELVMPDRYTERPYWSLAHQPLRQVYRPHWGKPLPYVGRRRPPRNGGSSGGRWVIR